MEGSSSRKRAFTEHPDSDSDSERAPKQKRVRFPKGKKVKPGTEPVAAPAKEAEEEVPVGPVKAVNAARERAKRRGQMTTELFAGEEENMPAEVRYKDNETFEDDGVQFEPFNLDNEREEGYFDEAGNFVEYVGEKLIKDAWLDNARVDPTLAAKLAKIEKKVVEAEELSSDDVGQMKRRIANALEPGETVLHALKRLKGHSNSRKEKMAPETKAIFDQLTEDAMKLMDNGDYDVYHEKREVFEREAEGYESLARARNVIAGNNDLSESGVAPAAGDDADSFDMFGDDEEPASVAQVSEGTFTGQSDYVLDESSGYYYSSSLGYFYDPSSGLYCNAATGQWYSFSEETGAYTEVQGTASGTSTEVQGAA